jgi:hypothetical protein
MGSATTPEPVRPRNPGQPSSCISAEKDGLEAAAIATSAGRNRFEGKYMGGDLLQVNKGVEAIVEDDFETGTTTSWSATVS